MAMTVTTHTTLAALRSARLAALLGLLSLLLLAGACSSTQKPLKHSGEPGDAPRAEAQHIALSEQTRALFELTPERAARMNWHVTSELVYLGTFVDDAKTVALAEGVATARQQQHVRRVRVVITPEATGRCVEVGPDWSYVVIDFGEGVRVRFNAGGYGQAVGATVDPELLPETRKATVAPPPPGASGAVLYYAPAPRYTDAERVFHRTDYTGARLAFEGRHHVERTTQQVVRTLTPGRSTDRTAAAPDTTAPVAEKSEAGKSEADPHEKIPHE